MMPYYMRLNTWHSIGIIMICAHIIYRYAVLTLLSYYCNMETTTQQQIAALKESITSDAAIETERMTIRRIPTVLSDVYFSKCCTIFYIIISVLCVALLILCCCLFQHANGNLFIRLHVVFNHWRGVERYIRIRRGVQHDNAQSPKLL